MPLAGKTDARFWLYKNVSGDPNLKQRWVSTQLLEKAIKHKYEDFEITSLELSKAIGKKVPNCHSLTVSNRENIYKCVHNYRKNKKKTMVFFFYFAGNNSVDLPPPPTANNLFLQLLTIICRYHHTSYLIP